MKLKHRTQSITAVAAVALLVFAVNVFAKPRHMVVCNQNPFTAMRVMVSCSPNCMHLDNKQQPVVDKLVKNFANKTLPVRRQLRAKVVMLRAELVQPKIDQQKIGVLVKEICGLRDQLFAARVQMKIKLNKAAE